MVALSEISQGMATWEPLRGKIANRKSQIGNGCAAPGERRGYALGRVALDFLRGEHDFPFGETL